MNARDVTHNLVNHLNHAVIVVDLEWNTLFMNPSAESMLGVSRRAASHFDIRELNVIDDAQGQGTTQFGEYIQRARVSGSTYTYREVVFELAEQRRTLTADCTLSFYVDEMDVIVIEFAQVDRIIRIAREETLIQQHQASREVMRGMAHEVKNPLGGIRGAAQLLSRELSEDQQEFTHIIVSEVDRLQSLVNQMLGPSRLPNKTENNIHEILEHIMRLLNAETNQGFVLTKDYDPSIPTIVVDRDQLIQALLNIARNAWEALGEDGEITLRTRILRRFTIGSTTHRLVLAIEIIDNGPGIPHELFETIFFPMVTGRSGGTGLGLPIAQSLINQHNGLIECESRPGKTCFSIFIPIEGAS